MRPASRSPVTFPDVSTHDLGSSPAPVATVVIPTHNRHEGLAELLDDLLRQKDLPGPIEVLVVDSAVAESAAEVVERAAAQGLAASYHLTVNSLASKRNVGGELATADVIMFADDDMRLPSGWVVGHLAALGGRDDVVSCGAIDFPDAWVASSNYYHFKQEWHRNDDDQDRDSLEPWRVVCMNMAMSRRLFEACGGWDPDFVHYGAEDLEFGHRVTREHGARLVLAPDGRAVHQEVKQDVVGFARKLYKAAYHGQGLLIAKAPECRRIPTLRMTEPGLASGLPDRLLYLVTSLLAWPWLVTLLARGLRVVDGRRWAFQPLPYRVLYLLSTRLGVRDRHAGRPDRSAEIA
nr:glycosyltransferase [Nocardioides luti]